MTDETMRFTVFCMENYKHHRNMTGKEVSELFKEYGVYRYLTDFFDLLHTTGDDYINRDIDAYLKARNALYE